MLTEYLEEKLNDQSFDFQKLFEIEESYAAAWPRGEWYNLKDPKGFFLDVCVLARKAWKEELHKASLEDQRIG